MPHYERWYTGSVTMVRTETGGWTSENNLGFKKITDEVKASLPSTDIPGMSEEVATQRIPEKIDGAPVLPQRIRVWLLKEGYTYDHYFHTSRVEHCPGGQKGHTQQVIGVTCIQGEYVVSLNKNSLGNGYSLPEFKQWLQRDGRSQYTLATLQELTFSYFRTHQRPEDPEPNMRMDDRVVIWQFRDPSGNLVYYLSAVETLVARGRVFPIETGYTGQARFVVDL